MIENNKTDLSVIICCFNSADRLPKTLEHLAQQKTMQSLTWEILLIDNNSTDDTSRTAVKIWQGLGSPVPMRVVLETKAGLTNARKRGALEAIGEFLIFCDDDNHLSDNYIQEAVSTLKLDPVIAVVAGNGTPTWQKKPPEWLQNCLGSLACKPQAYEKGDAGPDGFYGAGLVVRRRAMLQVFENFQLKLAGRIGTKDLVAGEDLELCLKIAILGYQLWGNPALTFKHAIAIERIDWDYMKSLRYATGMANARLAPISSVAQRREAAFKSQWFVQFLATLVRTCYYAVVYIFSKQHALKFWFQLARLRGLWSSRQSYSRTIERLVRVREHFAKVK